MSTISELSTITTPKPKRAKRIVYPSSDGRPMSDDSEHYRWIKFLQDNLEDMYADRSDVVVHGDLLWYPVHGDPKIRVAPDIMVAFGVKTQKRGSYQQWKEGGRPPKVAIEIFSTSNTELEMKEKREFCRKYGIDEFYIYHPVKNELRVWLRSGSRFIQVRDVEGWKSPTLGVKFKTASGELEAWDVHGKRFTSRKELRERNETALAKKDQVIAKKDQVIAKMDLAVTTKDEVIAEKDHAIIERDQVIAEKETALEAMRAKLRALGIDPDR